MKSTMTTIRAMLPAVIAGVALGTIGCADRTTRQDVANARDVLDERQEETAETARAAQQRVAQVEREAQRELAPDAERHTVNKPVLDEAAEQRLRIAEAKREADEAVAAKLEEEREAAEELRKTEHNFQETQAREAYVKDMRQKLEDLESRINELEEDASAAKGDERDALNERIEALENQHARAEEALDELKSAELTKWRGHQEKVRVAMDDLTSALNNIR